jgi:H-type lectin domain-containing protein
MSTIAPLSLLSAVVPLGSLLDGWTLLEGSGQRSYRHTVTFERHFSAPPVVHLGVVGLDASKQDNLRLRVSAEDISATGFTIVVETWLHTHLWAVDVSWLAIGG